MCRYRLTLIFTLLIVNGCIGWFVATVSPMNTRGQWLGTIVDVQAIDSRTGERVNLVGLRLSEGPAAIKRGNQTYIPEPGSVVVLVDRRGAPAKLQPTDGEVKVSGLWTDKWNASTLQGKDIRIRSATPKALGVLQVESVVPKKETERCAIGRPNQK